jgi:hypothetical protein
MHIGLLLGLGATFLRSGGPVVASTNKPVTRTQGGILHIITGSGFTGATGVTFGGTAATSVTVVNDTTITCVTPAKAAGAHAIVVTTPLGSSNTNISATFVNPTSIFGANLLRWYSQTYAAGAWTDESGNFNTVQATAGFRPSASTLAGTTDRPGTHVALSFDGTDDYLEAQSGSGQIAAAQMTVAAIARRTASAQYAGIIAKTFTGAPFGLRAGDGDGGAKSVFAVGSIADAQEARSNVDFPITTTQRLMGTWHQFDDGGLVQHYVNGALQTDTGASTNAGGATEKLAIGAWLNGAGNSATWFFPGLIAEGIIADVEADATQLAQLDAYLRDCAGHAP